MRLDHHLVVDFRCFRGIVDAVGGIEVEVPSRIVDPFYPSEDFGYRTVVFEPGLQRLDGARALEYVRTRYTTSDFSRMHRQQQVVAALQRRVLSLASLPSVPAILASCGGLATDLGVREVVGLLAAAREIRPEDISYLVIEPPMVADVVTPLGARVLQPRWELIRPLVQRAFPSTVAAGDTRTQAP